MRRTSPTFWRAWPEAALARRLALACSVLAASSGCGGASSSAPATPVISVAVAPPSPADDASEPDHAEPGRRSEPDATESGGLSAADCRAFESAGALGVAIVASVTADCSSVGHVRMLLEILELSRGEGIQLVEFTRTLAAWGEPNLEQGDTVVVAIQPADMPAETVHCVPFPARQGVVHHVLKVDNYAAGADVLARWANGRGCAREP